MSTFRLALCGLLLAGVSVPLRAQDAAAPRSLNQLEADLLDASGDRARTAEAHLALAHAYDSRNQSELAHGHLLQAVLLDDDLELDDDDPLAALWHDVRDDVSGNGAVKIAHESPAEVAVSPVPIAMDLSDAFGRVRTVMLESALVVDGQRVEPRHLLMKKVPRDEGPAHFEAELPVAMFAPGAVTTLVYNFVALDEFGDALAVADGGEPHEVLLHIVPPPVAGWMTAPPQALPQEQSAKAKTRRALPRITTVLSSVAVASLVTTAIAGGTTLIMLGAVQVWPFTADKIGVTDPVVKARVGQTLWTASVGGAVITGILIASSVAWAIGATGISFVGAWF